jgi:hypothetical protein
MNSANAGFLQLFRQTSSNVCIPADSSPTSTMFNGLVPAPQILEGRMQKAHREGTTDVETKSESENILDCTAIRSSPAW